MSMDSGWPMPPAAPSTATLRGLAPAAAALANERCTFRTSPSTFCVRDILGERGWVKERVCVLACWGGEPRERDALRRWWCERQRSRGGGALQA